jgi:hypothetical protein
MALHSLTKGAGHGYDPGKFLSLIPVSPTNLHAEILKKLITRVSKKGYD